MLHIILVILKIAGIFLAVVVGLLLLAVLLLLFVPLRYELSAGHSEKETYGRGRFTWFFHLISLRFSYERAGGKTLSLQIFGYRVFPRGEKKKPPGHMEKNGKSEAESEETFGIEPEEIRSERTEKKQESFVSKKISEEIETLEREEPVLEEIPVLESQKQKSTVEEEMEEEEKSRKTSILERLMAFFWKIRDLFVSVFQGMKRLAVNLKQAFRRLFQKFRSLYSQFQFYLEIWQEEETRVFRAELLSHMGYLIRHFKPRKANGFLRYGTDDPALTGQITGVLYLFRPLDFSELEILPDFEAESVFVEGDLSLKGHIRAFHAARIAWKLLFDKNLKHMRQRIKNRRNEL